VDAVNAQRSTWELVGFLDDSPDLEGREVDGVPVLGPVSAVEHHPGTKVVVTVGNPGNYFTRPRVVTRLGLPATRYATIIHPTASLAGTAEVGPGTVVLAMAVATASVRIGAHVIVMPQVVFTHDDVVGDYATFGAGVRMGGGVVVGRGAYVGSGATVREHRTIGPWALVGMGSVVTRDVPPAQVWAGVPSRFVRLVEVPEDLEP